MDECNGMFKGEKSYGKSKRQRSITSYLSFFAWFGLLSTHMPGLTSPPRLGSDSNVMILFKTKGSSPRSQEGIPGWCDGNKGFLGLQGTGKALRHHPWSPGKHHGAHGGIIFLTTSSIWNPLYRLQKGSPCKVLLPWPLPPPQYKNEMLPLPNASSLETKGSTLLPFIPLFPFLLAPNQALHS